MDNSQCPMRRRIGTIRISNDKYYLVDSRYRYFAYWLLDTSFGALYDQCMTDVE